MAKLKAGIHTMDAATYHSDPCDKPSLSASVAKVLINRSPAHAWTCHPRLNPNFEREEKEAYDIGTIAHDALLEGVSRIEIVKFNDWRTNAAKEQRDAARAMGLIPLLEKNYERVSVMVGIAREAIAACPDLSGITLADGKAEQTIVWEDVGTWCRARPDWLANDRSLMLDYKSVSTSAEPNDVLRTHVIPHCWDLQSAFYLRGLRCAEKLERDPAYVFMAQEIEPPYAVSFIGMPPAFLALGEQKVNRAIALWSDCLRTGEWPTYGNRIFWPEPPPWAEIRYVEKASTGTDLYEHFFGDLKK